MVAQKISDEIHNRCVNAKDYSGCIQLNSPESSDSSKKAFGSGDNSDGEKCYSDGFCVAKAGVDQLGLPKVVGWVYKYYATSNEVLYMLPQMFRVPHQGQPDRYAAREHVIHYYQQPVAGTSGYYRDATPAKTICRPNTTYTGPGPAFKWVDGVLHQRTDGGQTCTTTNPTKEFVPGTPATPGGPRKAVAIQVVDCKDKTYAWYKNGKATDKWKKWIGETKIICDGRSDYKVLNIPL
ncbi:hypothetical protein [Synechococcus sp. KORDI-100]|uniref:hypothetical protein n=1 Tax=Synechococcus sp. KORDI-100 TaxID=1280380 RepID=UPI0012DFE9EE|nr:hypothetical protein [Synechococcus sp. KORDI-100]